MVHGLDFPYPVFSCAQHSQGIGTGTTWSIDLSLFLLGPFLSRVYVEVKQGEEGRVWTTSLTGEAANPVEVARTVHWSEPIPHWTSPFFLALRWHSKVGSSTFAGSLFYNFLGEQYGSYLNISDLANSVLRMLHNFGEWLFIQRKDDV